MIRYSLHVSASIEIDEVFDYFEGRTSGLGHRFLDEVGRAISFLQTHPQGAAIATRRPVQVRRKQLKRFPYHIFDRYHAGAIRILAVSHAARGPFYWKNRR